jgi:hypothetical protein
MTQTTNVRTSEISVTAAGAAGPGLAQPGERRAGVRRVSIEQEKADFAAWLREYRRWTQTGCCAPARHGDIEWGGEEGGGATSH